MILPADFEVRIGFDKVRELLKKECSSELGQAVVDKMNFLSHHDKVEKLLIQTHEFVQIIQSGDYFPSSNFIDVSAHLKKSKVIGTFLTEEEFYELKLSLKTILDCLSFFDKNKEEYPTLYDLRKSIGLEKHLHEAIELKIDERGTIRDNASSELQAIRRDILSTQTRLRKTVDSVFRSARISGYIPEDVSITLRDGRLVIPVLAEYKRRVKGFVHDESSTGQTVYIEPTEALELNNEIRELQYRERREIVKILTDLTDLVRPELQNLEKAYRFLAVVDFVRAKARFALKTDAVKPELANERVLKWNNAKHPLLKLSLEKAGKTVVPLSMALHYDQRILIISGPNAGGKSVALKTVGLLQYMLQNGMLVPLDPDSTCGIFRNLFIDIGDQQSIENDLSTYSSHLANMKSFILQANKYSLFLIDEFGTGTEPQFGGAIAESILEKLFKMKAFGVITTHYDNIKNFAEKHKQVESGAMKFDERTLTPLYQLQLGKPGSSFALEVAEKMGIPKGILQSAKQKLGTQRVDYDKMLNTLGKEKRQLEDRLKSIESRERSLEETSKEYEELRDFVAEQKKTIVNQAKREAKEILKNANREIEQTIREIKENKADKKKTQQARASIKKLDETLVLDEEKPRSEPGFKVVGGEIGVGDQVKVKGQPAIGEVLSISGKEAQVMLGELKSTIKLNRLEKVSKRAAKREARKTKSTAGASMNVTETAAEFNMQLDVRGKRAEEAIAEADRFIDRALMLGHSEVSILHGRGDGILRQVLRDYLRQYDYIQSMKNEHEERGGDGITLVTLK